MRKACFIVLTFLFWFPDLSFAWEGRVLTVIDGDTITVSHNGHGEKIRLYGIDCPEKKQPYGDTAKRFTGEMVQGKMVGIKSTGQGKYKRTIAWVYVGEKCLNIELLKAGLAWHYKKYSNDSALIKLEQKARLEKCGLWSQKKPEPPWIYRK